MLQINVLLIFILVFLLYLPTSIRYVTVTCPFTNGVAIPLLSSAWANHPSVTRIYVWCLNISRALLPLSLLCYLNARIIHTLNTLRYRKNVFSRNRVTMMLLAVTGIFVISAFPDAALSTTFNVGYIEENCFYRGVREITDTFMAANSACNFPLFYTFNSLFASQFRHLCLPKCCIGRNPEIKVSN